MRCADKSCWCSRITVHLYTSSLFCLLLAFLSIYVCYPLMCVYKYSYTLYVYSILMSLLRRVGPKCLIHRNRLDWQPLLIIHCLYDLTIILHLLHYLVRYANLYIYLCPRESRRCDWHFFKFLVQSASLSDPLWLHRLIFPIRRPQSILYRLLNSFRMLSCCPNQTAQVIITARRNAPSRRETNTESILSIRRVGTNKRRNEHKCVGGHIASIEREWEWEWIRFPFPSPLVSMLVSCALQTSHCSNCSCKSLERNAHATVRCPLICNARFTTRFASCIATQLQVHTYTRISCNLTRCPMLSVTVHCSTIRCAQCAQCVNGWPSDDLRFLPALSASFPCLHIALILSLLLLLYVALVHYHSVSAHFSPKCLPVMFVCRLHLLHYCKLAVLTHLPSLPLLCTLYMHLFCLSIYTPF